MTVRRVRSWPVLIALALVSIPALNTRADVSRVEIDSRITALNGQPFANHGAYEQITGTVHYTFDPDNRHNAAIVDLRHAPRNDQGLVEATGDFVVLQPVDPDLRSGVALVEVCNRGGKATMSYFNGGGGGDPARERTFGDGLLMRHGITIVWIGWQWDVPDRSSRLRLTVPIARNDDGSSISGLLRADWVIDRAAQSLDIAHRDHIAYPVSNPDDPANVLTVRSGRDAPRSIVPRDKWHFGRRTRTGLTPDPTWISLDGGFEAGKIYELVYRAQDPRVVGLGLAAVRDIISFMKYDETCPFPTKQGIAMGISQTGRFLRHFLYQGFNTDEHDRQAYDGMLIHTAGAGRGSFNHRFAQPSRDAHRYSAFFYPTDLFPFSGREQTDPVTNKTDGLLTHASNPEQLPKIFYTNTGYEYWGRAASLLHISPDGKQDVPLLPNARLYHIASAQHYPGRFPPSETSRIEETDMFAGDPLDLLATERALLIRLVQWVQGEAPPPDSRYPTIADGTLVPIDQLNLPRMRALHAPDVVHVAYRADYGPRWDQGIIDNQPPKLGRPFTSLVPQVDANANEAAGVRGVELLVPLATYTPWSQRLGMPGPEHELNDFTGFLIPFPLTESPDDARPGISTLYEDRDDYLTRVRSAAEGLVKDGFLLEEDIDRAMERGNRLWDWIHR